MTMTVIGVQRYWLFLTVLGLTLAPCLPSGGLCSFTTKHWRHVVCSRPASQRLSSPRSGARLMATQSGWHFKNPIECINCSLLKSSQTLTA